MLVAVVPFAFCANNLGLPESLKINRTSPFVTSVSAVNIFAGVIHRPKPFLSHRSANLTLNFTRISFDCAGEYPSVLPFHGIDVEATTDAAPVNLAYHPAHPTVTVPVVRVHPARAEVVVATIGTGYVYQSDRVLVDVENLSNCATDGNFDVVVHKPISASLAL